MVTIRQPGLESGLGAATASASAARDRERDRYRCHCGEYSRRYLGPLVGRSARIGTKLDRYEFGENVLPASWPKWPRQAVQGTTLFCSRAMNFHGPEYVLSAK